jgi:hypothetical protein
MANCKPLLNCVPELAPAPESSTMEANFTVCCANMAVAGVIIAKAAINLIVKRLFIKVSPDCLNKLKILAVRI